MSAPDIVYVVAVGERNEALRYSLRSLVNLPHGKVWIAGYCPKWVNREVVGHIPVSNIPGGHRHAKANLAAACRHPDVSESFVYMNDDFFVMQPMDGLPIMHRGPLDEAVRTDRMASSYQRAMGKTLEILRQHGIDEPLMYDLHAPMTVTKTGMLEALALCSYPMIQERTVFGNLQQVGGEKRRNHKVRIADKGWQPWQFISTNDSSWRTGRVGEHIRSAFPAMSEYEATPPPPVRHKAAAVIRRPVRYRMGTTSTIRRVNDRRVMARVGA